MITTELSRPPSEFSLMPFWFWNDELSPDEIIRQMDDFQKHGVDGFVIHPRVGLPRHLGWMSDSLLAFYRVAIEEAQRRGMTVVLYDEGMYPSGSSSGQVVAANPEFACRCLAKIDLPNRNNPILKPGENLVAVLDRIDGSSVAVIDRPANSVIRGLHYIGDGPAEEEPPAADILNPLAVETFIHLVYDKFAHHFSSYFGNTIQAIFTDEPGLLGRSRERGIVPGTTGILSHINRILGYDFTPHLLALWFDDESDALRYRRDYDYALSLRLEETYYLPLYTWCETHGLALTGHPAKGDDIGPLRYFHIPGQDMVWRWVLPDDPTALEGVESTQAKCASSAMLHHGRRRNANEYCGAYGHELTWDEMTWLSRWAFVRGVNLLFPHAFYYSVRGPRFDERPPDVGPNSAWWDRFSDYAYECRRLSWINTDSEHICDLAILGRADFLPWRSAKICFRHQYDFNYVEERQLLENAAVDETGIHLAGMKYSSIIVDYEPSEDILAVLHPLTKAGGVFPYFDESRKDKLLDWVGSRIHKDVFSFPSAPALRVRHMLKNQQHYLMLFNEERDPLELKLELKIELEWIVYDPFRDQMKPLGKDKKLYLKGHELIILTTQS